MLRIAVLISGGGSNLLSIIDNIESGYLDKIDLRYVISDRENAKGINIAKERGYNTIVLDMNEYGKKLSDEILKKLNNKVDFIVLAGYLSILTGDIIKVFNNKIINIHPSLIPSFCGKGMYGIKVHEAAIKKGVKYSGCTVHFVNDGVDEGKIIDQSIVKVYKEDTAKDLQGRILKEEHKLLPKVLKELSSKKSIEDYDLVTSN
ncbi:phosphoribosylglycinamide formyltransferase [Clostridium massiliamazoniense]|uniref:phosphoribosylglycinamide formyltransferase n=1 Tax=Clostridium massiliamazoniense TaxID=1347366 RepID=UPI0006D7C425|nr:phosphoribosylglycinamide formyltransferase [Clostridium massiliamazoniense]